ncbi:MAG: hypothetical protein J6D12_04515 [Peptostreptococcaceae bacterium]|nr:hypothetical protein [Peptostreptococcaceae bacterium]
MRVLKINKKDYVLKFTTKALMNLNAKGITLTSLASDMEKLNLISLYEAFHEGLKFANKEITLDQTYEIIDSYYEEAGEVEEFFTIVLEEYSKAMGLGNKFKEIMKQQQN